jgi:hypothetical protein
VSFCKLEDRLPADDSQSCNLQNVNRRVNGLLQWDSAGGDAYREYFRLTISWFERKSSNA